MSERNVVNLTRLITESSASGSEAKPSFPLKTSAFLRNVLDRCVEVTEPDVLPNSNLNFHLRMACGALAVLIVSFVGCKLTSIHTDVSGRMIAIVAMLAMVAPLPLYWHEKGRAALREAALVIPWELLLAATLSFPVLIAARLRLPLQDSLFGRIDQSLGVSVPSIQTWANHHWLGTVINRSYPWLLPLLAISCFAPPLLGHVKHAREFLLGNLAAFAIGLPLFALLPAVGPWYYYHLHPIPPRHLVWPNSFRCEIPALICFKSRQQASSASPRFMLSGLFCVPPPCGDFAPYAFQLCSFRDDHRLHPYDGLALLCRRAGRHRRGRPLDGHRQSVFQ